jgi:hypothetical protein
MPMRGSAGKRLSPSRRRAPLVPGRAVAGPPKSKGKTRASASDLIAELDRGSQILHDLAGSLGAVALHLRLAASAAALRPSERQHINAAMTAIQTTGEQVARVSALLKAGRQVAARL